MKIATRDISGFIKSPPPSFRAIVVYGPNQDLVSEYAAALAKTVCEDLGDAFQVSTLSADQISDDAALLASEACAQSLMGGRRVVRVLGDKAAVASALEDVMAQDTGDTLIVVAAGDLKATNALRKLAEKHKEIAAIACYDESARDLAGQLQELLQDAQLSLPRELHSLILDLSGGNRKSLKLLIEKIACYHIGAPQDEITPEIIQVLAGDVAAADVDNLISGFCDRHVEATNTSLNLFWQQKSSPVMILRLLQNHLLRLYQVQSAVESGVSQDDALRSLRPPLFFKTKPQFMQHLRSWNCVRLETALAGLQNLEAQSKSLSYRPLETTISLDLKRLSMRRES